MRVVWMQVFSRSLSFVRFPSKLVLVVVPLLLWCWISHTHSNQSPLFSRAYIAHTMTLTESSAQEQQPPPSAASSLHQGRRRRPGPGRRKPPATRLCRYDSSCPNRPHCKFGHPLNTNHDTDTTTTTTTRQDLEQENLLGQQNHETSRESSPKQQQQLHMSSDPPSKRHNDQSSSSAPQTPKGLPLLPNDHETNSAISPTNHKHIHHHHNNKHNQTKPKGSNDNKKNLSKAATSQKPHQSQPCSIDSHDQNNKNNNDNKTKGTPPGKKRRPTSSRTNTRKQQSCTQPAIRDSPGPDDDENHTASDDTSRTDPLIPTFAEKEKTRPSTAISRQFRAPDDSPVSQNDPPEPSLQSNTKDQQTNQVSVQQQPNKETNETTNHANNNGNKFVKKCWYGTKCRNPSCPFRHPAAHLLVQEKGGGHVGGSTGATGTTAGSATMAHYPPSASSSSSSVDDNHDDDSTAAGSSTRKPIPERPPHHNHHKQDLSVPMVAKGSSSPSTLPPDVRPTTSHSLSNEKETPTTSNPKTHGGPSSSLKESRQKNEIGAPKAVPVSSSSSSSSSAPSSSSSSGPSVSSSYQTPPADTVQQQQDTNQNQEAKTMNNNTRIQRHKKKCRYGSHCQNPSCLFRHPPTTTTQAVSVEEEGALSSTIISCHPTEPSASSFPTKTRTTETIANKDPPIPSVSRGPKQPPRGAKNASILRSIKGNLPVAAVSSSFRTTVTQDHHVVNHSKVPPIGLPTTEPGSREPKRPRDTQNASLLRSVKGNLPTVSPRTQSSLSVPTKAEGELSSTIISSCHHTELSASSFPTTTTTTETFAKDPPIPSLVSRGPKQPRGTKKASILLSIKGNLPAVSRLPGRLLLRIITLGTI